MYKREAACYILEPSVLEIIITINLIDLGMKYLWHGIQTLRLCYASRIEVCPLVLKETLQRWDSAANLYSRKMEDLMNFVHIPRDSEYTETVSAADEGPEGLSSSCSHRGIESLNLSCDI